MVNPFIMALKFMRYISACFRSSEMFGLAINVLRWQEIFRASSISSKWWPTSSKKLSVKPTLSTPSTDYHIENIEASSTVWGGTISCHVYVIISGKVNSLLLTLFLCVNGKLSMQKSLHGIIYSGSIVCYKRSALIVDSSMSADMLYYFFSWALSPTSNNEDDDVTVKNLTSLSLWTNAIVPVTPYCFSSAF